jgi:hypothetical protein
MQVAKAKGHLRGKQPKLTAKQAKHLVELADIGTYSTAELAELFGVSRSTVYRTLLTSCSLASAVPLEAASSTRAVTSASSQRTCPHRPGSIGITAYVQPKRDRRAEHCKGNGHQVLRGMGRQRRANPVCAGCGAGLLVRARPVGAHRLPQFAPV